MINTVKKAVRNLTLSFQLVRPFAMKLTTLKPSRVMIRHWNASTRVIKDTVAITVSIFVTTTA